MARRTGAEAREARRERLERHAAETDPAVVLNAAARYLELRSRSVAEMRRHLTAASFPLELVEAAIARLVELGMLDDRAFATAWVESRDRARPRGEVALRRELHLKGIDPETIAAVLVERSETASSVDGTEFNEGNDRRSADGLAAARLLARSSAALKRVDDLRVRRGRAYALLARNGFDPDVCREAASHFVAGGMDGVDQADD